jgi:hypothetical protein
MGNQKNKSYKDTLINIKHIAYRMVQSNNDLEGRTWEDLINHCKFYLCNSRKVLFKDPIWDIYSDEEILVEYHAAVFSKDPDALKVFENYLLGGEEAHEDFDWMEAQVRENQKALNEYNKEDEEFKLTPDDFKKETDKK